MSLGVGAALKLLGYSEADALTLVQQRHESCVDEPIGTIPRVLRIVAEHYARSAPADSISELIAGLPKAAPADAESILIGWAKGWPRDKRLQLSPDAEQALVKLVTTVPPAGRGALVNLASRWGSKALEAHVAEIAKSFFTAAADDKAKDSDRAAAARQLIEFRKTDAAAAADLAKLITPRTSVELSSGIVEAIGANQSGDKQRGEVAERFLERDGVETGDPAVERFFGRFGPSRIAVSLVTVLQHQQPHFRLVPRRFQFVAAGRDLWRSRFVDILGSREAIASSIVVAQSQLQTASSNPTVDG